MLALGLAACSESSQPLPQEVDFQFTAGPACDYQPVKKDARSFFPKSLDRTVQEMIRAMQQAETDAEATDVGFDILALVAQVTRDGLQDGSLEDGSDLTNGLLACMTFESGAPAEPIDFSAALDLGAYEVRGGPDDPTYPVVSRLCDDPSMTCPVGTWGVEPAAGEHSWQDVTGGQRYLLYGAVTTPPSGGETQLTETFEWNTVPLLPSSGFVEDVRVARCSPPSEDTVDERVQRGTGIPIILPFSEPTFCGDFTAAANFGSGLFGTLKQWTHAAGSLLMPRPLHASASVKEVPCCGGTAGGFTPFVVVTAGHVNLTFESGPFDAAILPGDEVANLLPVVISAKGDNGTPLPEVTITVTVELNQGSWVVLGGTTSLVTDPDCSSTIACEPTGTVTFDDLTLNKPGGYRLVATASLFGYDLAVFTSEAFHITQ